MSTYRPPPGRPRSIPPMPNDAAPQAADGKLPKRLLDEAGMVTAYKGGMSGQDVQTTFRCTSSQLYRALEKHGIQPHYPKRPDDPLKPEETKAPPTEKPVRLLDENQQAYTARIIAWKRAADPEYDAQVRRNLRLGQLRRAARRRRATPTAAIVQPRLTVWQRIKKWFA